MGQIYIIRNEVNNKAYIGKTTRTITLRFNEHLNAAKNGSQCPIHAAIRKYGQENFSIACLAQGTGNRLNELEKRFIVEHHTSVRDHGYNLTDGGDGTSGFKRSAGACTGRRNSFYGRTHTYETKQRIRASLFAYFERVGRKRNQEDLTPQERAERKSRRLSVSLKKRWREHGHPMKGHKHTKETRHKMSQAKLGKTLSEQHKQAIGDGVRGLIRGKQSTEHREKLRRARIGKSFHVKPVLKLTLDNRPIERYDSVKAAARSIATTNVALIRACCNNQREQAYGFKWNWIRSS
jgi:group I intron endonuclease